MFYVNFAINYSFLRLDHILSLTLFNDFGPRWHILQAQLVNSQRVLCVNCSINTNSVLLYFLFYYFQAQVFTCRLHTVPCISNGCRNTKYLTIFVGGTLKVVATLHIVCCFSWIGSSLCFTLVFIVVAILNMFSTCGCTG